MFETIDYHGTEITVEYEVSGKYYPATREQPEEFPEIEIIAIWYNGIDVLELLEFDIDYINELLNEQVEL